MKRRKERVEAIVDLIRHNCIVSQEDLARRLAERGFPVTQATLSRDLKMLKTTKVATDKGNYMYILPDSNRIKDQLLAKGQTNKLNGYHSGFVSIAFSGNMVVIKTRQGYAPGMAYDIDMSATPEILGTIPGSDTIFAVMREEVSHERALRIFMDLLPIDPDTLHHDNSIYK